MKLTSVERALLIDAVAVAVDDFNYDGYYQQAEDLTDLMIKILDAL